MSRPHLMARLDEALSPACRLLGLQAYLAHGLGKEEESLQQAAQAVTLLGDEAPMFRSMLLTLMGQVYRQVGSTAEAVKSLRDALRIGEQLGYNSLFIYLPLAGIYYDGNQIAEARQCLEHGFELCRQLGFNPIVVGGGRETMSGVLHAEGDIPAALAFAHETSQLAQDFHLPWISRMAASIEATLLLWDGQQSAAERLVEEAQLAAHLAGNPTPDQDFTIFCLARLLIVQGKLGEARALLDRLMAGGLSNAEIARKLYLTVNTLKAYTNSIYGKLDVHSRMQAVILARELGYLG